MTEAMAVGMDQEGSQHHQEKYQQHHIFIESFSEVRLFHASNRQIVPGLRAQRPNHIPNSRERAAIEIPFLESWRGIMDVLMMVPTRASGSRSSIP